MEPSFSDSGNEDEVWKEIQLEKGNAEKLKLKPGFYWKNGGSITGSDLHANSLYIKMKRKQIQWLDIGGGGPDPDRDESDIYIGTDTMKEWSSQALERGKLSRSEKHLGDQFIPVRNDQGNPMKIQVKRHPSTQFKEWEGIRDRAIERSQAGEGAGRCLDPNIEIFLIPVSPEVEDMLVSAFEATRSKLHMVEIEIDKKVETWARAGATGDKGAVAAAASPSSSKDPTKHRVIEPRCKQKVKVWSKRPGNVLRDYKMLSISPLGHYETWIHISDYNSYVQKRPDRELPKKIEIEKISLKRRGLDAKLDAQAQKAMVALHKEINQKTGEGEKFSSSRSEILKDVHDKPNDDILATYVTAAKIRNAPSGQGRSQRLVMGMSATKIAQDFEWKPDPNTTAGSSHASSKRSVIWPQPAFAEAEWLHRSAYSWGGLLAPEAAPAKKAAETSQIFRNLIFGTSECNSIMTRYEEVFKALINREETAGGSGGSSTGRGILVTKIRRDKYKKQFADAKEQNSPQHFQEAESKPTWLCCAMDYTLYLNDREGRVGKFNGPYQTTFYPFQRGFYTKFEKNLDFAILDAIYEPKTPSKEEKEHTPKRAVKRDGAKPAAEDTAGPSPRKHKKMIPLRSIKRD